MVIPLGYLWTKSELSKTKTPSQPLPPIGDREVYNTAHGLIRGLYYKLPSSEEGLREVIRLPLQLPSVHLNCIFQS
jgi:hypothetical protein